jgi:hypothetical protein
MTEEEKKNRSIKNDKLFSGLQDGIIKYYKTIVDMKSTDEIVFEFKSESFKIFKLEDNFYFMRLLKQDEEKFVWNCVEHTKDIAYLSTELFEASVGE